MDKEQSRLDITSSISNIARLRNVANIVEISGAHDKDKSIYNNIYLRQKDKFEKIIVATSS